MKIPLQITFRNMDPSDAMEAAIRKKVNKLEQFNDRITSCRVMVESDHARHHKGNLYHVRIDLTMPGAELVAGRQPSKNHAHEDAYVAIRDAFDAARRQLEDKTRIRQRKVKHHEAPAHGRVSELMPPMDYGRIETADGRDIYFHRNSLINGDFNTLEVGSEVRFSEEEGEEGPKATTVRIIGKHHIAE